MWLERVYGKHKVVYWNPSRANFKDEIETLWLIYTAGLALICLCKTISLTYLTCYTSNWGKIWLNNEIDLRSCLIRVRFIFNIRWKLIYFKSVTYLTTFCKIKIYSGKRKMWKLLHDGMYPVSVWCRAIFPTLMKVDLT